MTPCSPGKLVPTDFVRVMRGSSPNVWMFLSLQLLLTRIDSGLRGLERGVVGVLLEGCRALQSRGHSEEQRCVFHLESVLDLKRVRPLPRRDVRPLLEEMCCQRLAQDFQLVERVSSQAKRGDWTTVRDCSGE